MARESIGASAGYAALHASSDDMRSRAAQHSCKYSSAAFSRACVPLTLPRNSGWSSAMLVTALCRRTTVHGHKFV